MNLGLKPGATPKAKPGDHERALALLASLADPKATKKSLAELQNGTLAHDQAREAAEVAERKAAERDKAAQASEADATRARQLQADESAAATAALGKREAAVQERERVAAECEQSQTARDQELTRREDHLRKAGVRGF